MKFKLLLTMLTTVFIITSCNNTYDEAMLIGSWRTEKWVVKETNKPINQKMVFQFKADKSYTIDYGSQNESGNYWIASSYLHTVETGAAEKKVRIISITSDKIELEMNRSGQLELLTLIKFE